MNLENRSVIDRLARWLLALMTLGCAVVAFLVQDASLPFSWTHLGLDLLGTACVAVLMPYCFRRPNYSCSILFGELWPLPGKWPVWVFWLGIHSIAFHATSASRLALFQQTVDYNLVRALIEAIWLWLIYNGKISGWRGFDGVGDSERTPQASV
jgi:hypothetical protein